MVALLKPKPREPRHYGCGPIYHDQPLKVFDESRLDLLENQQRLAARSWWPEKLLMVLAGIVAVVWMWRG